MENRRNYYRILQVQSDAPFEVIHASYCTLLRELKQHPDLGGDHWNASILNEAYNTLRDRRKRAEYDEQLFNYYTKNPSPEKSSNKQSIFTIFCPICKRPLARQPLLNETCPVCRSSTESLNEKDKTQTDRRFVNRIKRQGIISYLTSSYRKEQEAKIVDLSLKGMRFLCTKELNSNLIINIKSSLLNATAKVMDSRQKSQKGRTFYTVGILFLTVTFNNEDGTFLSVTA